MATHDGSGDWRDGKCIACCVTHLYMSDHLTDVTFTFANDVGAEVKGHRLLLAARSKVFEAMFYGPMKETSTVINIVDIEADIFKMMLRYIYSDSAELTGSNVLPCLYAAQKYCINGMVKICAEVLENHISLDNVCSILQHATLYDMAKMADSCLNYIGLNLYDVLITAEFEGLSQSIVTKVMSKEDTETQEFERFQVLHRWSRAQCKTRGRDESPTNIRHEMGGALYQIRLPLIPVTKFNSIVVESDILTLEETKALTKYISGESKKEDEVCGFSSRPRQGIGYLVDLTPPMRKSRHGMISYTVSFVVKTNHTLYLKSLYISRSYPCKAVQTVTQKWNFDTPKCDITKHAKLLEEQSVIAFRPSLHLPPGQTLLVLELKLDRISIDEQFSHYFKCLGASGTITTAREIQAVRFVKQ